MALSIDEMGTLERLEKVKASTAYADELHLNYYLGAQRLEQLGMAIPPSMRRFLVIANWARVVVDTKVNRQQVRSLVLPGQETADPQLQAIWDGSNLSSHLNMFNRDRMIYGRAFLSVGSNENNPDLPLVRVESPREMVAEVDYRHERVTVAARFYDTDTTGAPVNATLFLPEQTIWAVRRDGLWVELDRDMHNLGQVPVVMHLNRRMSAAWGGESELTDIIPLVDAAARSLTNLQFAQESHGIPRMFMTGVAQEDFIDKRTGKPVPKFEAYFNAIHTLTKSDAKVGQLTAADLKNFETALQIYGKQASIVTGFPARYFGLTVVNPASEGAIVADESLLNRSVESDNAEVGMSLGWVAALALRFANGEWVEGNRVRVDWQNPATPTQSQRADAIIKLMQAGVLSREGAWDELGWTEARKAKERTYFAAQAQSDPATQAALAVMNGGVGAAG